MDILVSSGCLLGVLFGLLGFSASAADVAPHEAKPPQKGSGIDFAAKEDPAQERFTADRWSRGLHLFAGLGLNEAFYRLDARQSPYGMGIGATSAVGYAFNSDWMIEVTSNLAFRRDAHFFLWDSIFAPGTRFRLNGLSFSKNSTLYGRGLVGWSMEVLIPHGVEERTHISGPVVGVGIGLMQGKAKETVWFLEVISYAHFFYKQYLVIPGSDHAWTTSVTRREDRLGLALSVSAGILLF